MGEQDKLPQTIGRYEVQRLLGAGAMGSVFLADDPRIKRKVAVKTVKLDAIRNDQDRHEFMARFQREAEVSGLLNHPGIVAIYDVGESEQGPFLAMEYVAGKPLDALIKAQTPLTLGQRLKIAAAVAEALDHAHARGIVHRDVKPGNIMVSDDLKPKLMDFGIAKREDASLTQTGTFLGTPSYASPEQIKEGTVDNRSDIFSFGVLVFELISGQSPFPGSSINTILYKIVNEPPIEVQPPVTGILPDAWKRVFDRVLSKKPQDRHPSCTTFIRDLVDAVAEGEKIDRHELLGILKQGGDGPLPQIVSRAHDETLLVPQPEGGKGKGLLIGGGLATAVAIAAWVMIGGGTKPVLVKSRPEGATVYINSVKQDLPTSNNFKLKEGDLIRIEAKGYQPSPEIRYSKAEGFPPEVPLAPIITRVELKSDPEGAAVVLEGKEVGVTPLVIESWNQGEAHDLTLSKGDLMYTRRFLVGEAPADAVLKLEKRASAATVEPPLDPNAKGFLSLKGAFSVNVKVDGADRGSLAPGGKLELTPGSHKVELASPKHFFKETRTLSVAPGQGSPLNLPGLATITVETFPGTGRVSIDGLDAGIESDQSSVTVAHGTHTITVRGPKGIKSVTETIGGDKAIKFQL
ncbi:MAG TPA: serine/threonine-protein kinase [Holophagaceae bacterium]|nr:serine/threonine-protein kinase [Holophagaceae bacterium]